jgi:hypothetical protein
MGGPGSGRKSDIPLPGEPLANPEDQAGEGSAPPPALEKRILALEKKDLIKMGVISELKGRIRALEEKDKVTLPGDSQGVPTPRTPAGKKGLGWWHG